MHVGHQESILKDLEPYFSCKLEFDKNNSCLIALPNKPSIQIEFTRYGMLLVACGLGIVEGRFRDFVFKEALRANYFYLPSQGAFGFSKKSNQLYIYIMLDPQILNKNDLGAFFNPLIQRATKWAEYLAKNDIPPLEKLGE